MRVTCGRVGHVLSDLLHGDAGAIDAVSRDYRLPRRGRAMPGASSVRYGLCAQSRDRLHAQGGQSLVLRARRACASSALPARRWFRFFAGAALYGWDAGGSTPANTIASSTGLGPPRRRAALETSTARFIDVGARADPTVAVRGREIRGAPRGRVPHFRAVAGTDVAHRVDPAARSRPHGHPLEVGFPSTATAAIVSDPR